MVYATNIAAFNRKIIHVVKIVLDRCNNTFGNAPCTATGTVCHYAFPTCKDTANYVKTTRNYWFQSAGQPLLANLITQGIRPYLLDDRLSPVAQRIDPERAVTEHASMDFEFLPDWGSIMPLPPMDHDKGSGKYDTATVGEFWRLLWARNPNYNQREIFYYHGFEGDSEGDLQLKWWGVIENVKLPTTGGCQITATDKLKQVKHKTVPNAVRSSNVTTLEMDAAATSIPVTDASEFKVFTPDLVIKASVSGLFRIKTSEVDNLQEVESFTPGTGLTWAAQLNRYFTMSGSNLQYANPDGSAFNTVADTTITIRDLAWDSDAEVLYGTSGTDLYSINVDSGVATLLGSHGATYTNIRGLAYNRRNQTLYGVHSGATDALVTISKTAGTATLVGTHAGATHTGLAYDFINNVLYSCNSALGDLELNRINITTGAVTSLGIVDCTFLEMYPYNARSFIKIEDTAQNSGNEYRELLAIDTATNTLTVMPDPLNGSTNYAHGLGVKVLQVAPILDWNDATWQTGVNAVRAILHILTDWIGYDHDEIDIEAFTNERRLWVPGDLVRGVIEKPTEGDKVLGWIREVIRAHLWVNESQQIEFKTTHPVNEHTDTITEVDEDENVIDDPAPSLDANTDKQVTRVVVLFDKQGSVESKTESPDEYNGEFVYINATLENVNYHNEELTHTIHAPFVYREQEAKAMAVRYLRRFGNAPATYKFAVDPKDHAIKTGDVIRLTSPDFMGLSGEDGEADLEVLQKQEGADGMIHLECFDTKFSRNYGFIGHAGAADWGSASATEKLHAYIGGAEQPDGKCLMSDGSEGYAIY